MQYHLTHTPQKVGGKKKDEREMTILAIGPAVDVFITSNMDN